MTEETIKEMQAYLEHVVDEESDYCTVTVDEHGAVKVTGGGMNEEDWVDWGNDLCSYIGKEFGYWDYKVCDSSNKRVEIARFKV